MKFKIFSVFDSKAENFNTPVFMPTEGQALRSFDDMVKNKESEISKHPEDYTLFVLGEFDSDIGLVTPLNTPKSLGLATEFTQ